MAKKRIVIDTDGVVDDCRAISLAVQHEAVEVVAISTVIGCVSAPQAAANVARTLRVNGIAPSAIPIYQGAEQPFIGNNHNHEDEKHFFGSDGLGGRPNDVPVLEQSDFAAAVPAKHAANALVDLFRANQGQLTLVCLGPLTNIAMALKLEPLFAGWVKELVMMGGNVFGAGNVKSHSTAEFNFSNDPEAAHIVLAEMQCPITVVPWECFLFPSEKHVVDFHAHLQVDSSLARYFALITARGREVLGKTNIQYAYCDEIAMASAIDPEGIILEDRKLRGSVELHGSLTRGQVALDWTEGFWSEDFLSSGKFCQKRRPIRFVTKYNISLLDQMMHETVRKCP